MAPASLPLFLPSAPLLPLRSTRRRPAPPSTTPYAKAAHPQPQSPPAPRQSPFHAIQTRLTHLYNFIITKPSLHAVSALSGLRDTTFRALHTDPHLAECPIPQNPPFDPILSLNLAAYAFRAYLEPPSHAYRETYATRLPQDDPNCNPAEGSIYTDFVYPTLDLIAASATGLFMLHLHGDVGEGFVTSTINNATSRDVLSLKHLSVLRIPSQEGLMDDILTLNLYSNKSAYRAGVLPTHSASISVKKLVEDAFSVGGSVDGPAREMRLRPVEDDEGRADYFTFSLLPTQLKLPFGMRFYDEPGDEVELDRDYSLVVRISFVPFSELGVDEIANEQKEMARASKHLHDDEDDEDANSALEALEEALEDAIEDDFANMSRAEQRRRDTVALVLRSKLAPGKMPDPVDWKRLSRAVQSLYARLKDDFITQRTSTVTENAPAALFVESLGTDTEVWFFHDEANKDIVVSFRGTEQVSWRDFFTDAQVFLQQWTPGEEIDLRVDPSRTVGLAFMPDCFAPGEVPCDASAVHYGFLRAYLSIRDAILRGLHMLCDGDYANYSFHFTGHSLGGALATIAAVDFRARHLEEDADVCCMSYGAPKVGNVNFARLFNNLVPNSFRIVNDTDLVSRMPRSITGRNVLGKYKHSGRTALVNEVGEYWIQGLNDSTLHDSNCSITNPFRDRFQNLRELLDREKELWEELFSGRSVQHHMEDSYFMAMHQVVKRFFKDNN